VGESVSRPACGRNRSALARTNPILLGLCLGVVPHPRQSRDRLLNLLVPKYLCPHCSVVLPGLALHGRAPFSSRPRDTDVTNARNPIYSEKVAEEGQAEALYLRAICSGYKHTGTGVTRSSHPYLLDPHPCGRIVTWISPISDGRLRCTPLTPIH
jgi:hypothetical protein